jgi:hypothetical protein
VKAAQLKMLDRRWGFFLLAVSLGMIGAAADCGPETDSMMTQLHLIVMGAFVFCKSPLRSLAAAVK